MKYRTHKVMWGLLVLVPMLMLTSWAAAAPANRCRLTDNLGFVHLAKGTLGASRGELEQAADRFGRALLDGCQPDAATFGLGQAYAGLGEPTSALTALQASDARADLRHLFAGQANEMLGRPDDAWFEYAQLPRDAAARFYRSGDRAEKAGDFRQAVRNFSVATTINPAYPKAYYRAAFVYWRRLGDEDKAAWMIRLGLAVEQKPSVERDFYQGLLCYFDQQNGCAVSAWVSALREPGRLDPDSSPRYLAYEMLSRALVETSWRTPWQLALAQPGPTVQ